ncbi:hypothetical protein BT96DRAFT_556624 [Gymnopus androsaceus JB14]|uniref:Uncharacterized protein n=1 Tax=Gymnopus androsaceus JB14 TaxID=1447944 RepID=A0A6A4HWF8_9AGAR|nr:hypothetical protein BT96DRAFT_556624 [Gymnopus androsaceus JB14]
MTRSYLRTRWILKKGEMDMSLTTMESADFRYGNSTLDSADSRYTNETSPSVYSMPSSPKNKNETMGVPHLVITSNPPVPGFQLTSPGSPRSGVSGSSPSPISAAISVFSWRSSNGPDASCKLIPVSPISLTKQADSPSFSCGASRLSGLCC